MKLEHQIESIIFSADHPVKITELLLLFEQISPEDSPNYDAVIAAIEQIKKKLYEGDFAFELRETGGGFQFLTKPDYHALISQYLNLKTNRSLSHAALETLSIIAYKEPITKGEIEEIRGVNCDYTVQKLLEKDLIELAGKKETPGKPIMYRVSQSFLDYFGINSTADLPKLKEVIPENENAIGESPESGN